MPLPVFNSSLRPHPRTPAPMIRCLDVELSRSPAGRLSFTYRLFGDMARLRIPGPGSPERRDGLWEHTCFEAFIAGSGAVPYREFNFSPSGQWAAYDFVAHRQAAGQLAQLPPPQIRAQRTEGRLQLSVELDAAALPEGFAEAELEIGLCAVVESLDTVDDARSYWALYHPCALPDFHDRRGFTLTLPVAT